MPFLETLDCRNTIAGSIKFGQEGQKADKTVGWAQGHMKL